VVVFRQIGASFLRKIFEDAMTTDFSQEKLCENFAKILMWNDLLCHHWLAAQAILLLDLEAREQPRCPGDHG
jgi:hypothetical protein